MNQAQKTVLIGMITASIATVIFVGLLYYFIPWPTLSIQTMGQRLAFALRCDVFAILGLWIDIAGVAKQRFFSPKAIDGSEVGKSLVINVHIINNTVEQTLLLLVTHLALATILPVTSLHLIPILVAWFIIARILFFRAPSGTGQARGR